MSPRPSLVLCMAAGTALVASTVCTGVPRVVVVQGGLAGCTCQYPYPGSRLLAQAPCSSVSREPQSDSREPQSDIRDSESQKSVDLASWTIPILRRILDKTTRP